MYIWYISYIKQNAMSKINYLNMMLSGYFKNPDLLKIYLIRNQQLAERDNFLSLVEFYNNCNITLENVKQQILSLYYERKKELYWILSDRKTKKIDTTDIQKEIDFLKPDNFKIPLLLITNQQFTGHLSYSNIEFIESIIKQIFIYVDNKKDYTLQCNEGNYFYSGSENKLYTGRDFFVKIYLTKGKLSFPINFPDLIPKYYDLALDEYLTTEKNKASSFFDVKLVTKEFLNSELKKTQNLINNIENSINRVKTFNFKLKKEQLKYCKRYSLFLSEKFKDLEKIEIDKPQQRQSNLLKFREISGELEALELYPDVKCDLKETIDTIREIYSEKFLNDCKGEVTQKLFLNNEPDIFFMRELDEVLNITNASIFRISLKFKEFTELYVESFGREISLDRYFQMSLIAFKDFYTFAKVRIKETNLLLKNEKRPLQTETKKPDEILLKNKYPTVFINDLGFTLFSKMFEFYKDEKTSLANFSFLFFAMKKDYLVCGQSDFIKFLSTENYNIHIDKIDSRQWSLDMSKNKKSKLYNSIKDQLQEKHKKSTNQAI